MKITDKFIKGTPSISFEVFPPKEGSDFEKIETAVTKIAKMNPDFISVTYGAMGTNNKNTLKLASKIQNTDKVDTLAHLTSITLTKNDVKNILGDLRENNIQNILALRGDIPKDTSLIKSDYKYARDLILDIKEFDKNFCVGGACYPEGHFEIDNKHLDILNLKEKVDAGCDFLATQMFFDNDILYNYLYKIRDIGINVPVIAGIMPVTNANQIKRILKFSNTSLPRNFSDIIDRFANNPLAMYQAGINYASYQIVDLVANGVDGIHLYTMNKPHIAYDIMKSIHHIIGYDLSDTLSAD